MVPSVLQASRGNCGLAAPGLRFPSDRVVLGSRTAADRLSHGSARTGIVRVDARGARHANFFRHQATREFCWRDELRYLPDVFRFLGSLPFVAGMRRKAASLLYFLSPYNLPFPPSDKNFSFSGNYEGFSSR